jgi:hypothetical protein
MMNICVLIHLIQNMIIINIYANKTFDKSQFRLFQLFYVVYIHIHIINNFIFCYTYTGMIYFINIIINILIFLDLT